MMNNTAFTKDIAEALGYSVYMMIGSYFAKTQVSSRLMEERLCIAHSEVRKDRQYDMEERAERYGMKNIFPYIPEKWLSQAVSVGFNIKDQNSMDIIFTGTDFRIVVSCSIINGRYIFSHKVYKIRKNASRVNKAA